MLWSDQLWLTSADLDSIDGEASAVATSEGLQLDQINGVCHRSLEESGRALMRSLVGFAGFLAGDGLSANHLQAVFNVGTPAVQRTRVLLDNIVVSGANAYLWSDIKNWAVHSALVYLYRTAANRNLNDRYAAKRDAYQKQLRWELTPQLTQLGIPVIYRPMPCPAAFGAHNAGVFSIATSVGASSFTGVSIDVAITYIDQNYTGGANGANNQSHVSVITALSPSSSQSITVDISNLIPPNGNGAPEDVARCIVSPLNATGWNIYAGLHGGPLRLQNASPISISTKVHTLTALNNSLPAAGNGQWPNQYMAVQPTLNKG